MNITGALTGISQSQSMSQVGTAMLSKQLDSAEQMGDNMAKMIAQAPAPSLETLANPSVGRNFDMTV